MRRRKPFERLRHAFIAASILSVLLDLFSIYLYFPIHMESHLLSLKEIRQFATVLLRGVTEKAYPERLAEVSSSDNLEEPPGFLYVH